MVRGRLSRWFFIALPLAALAVAVAHAAPPAKPVTATEMQNNTRITVPPGGALVVRLESNVTTGYSWAIGKNDPAALKPLGKPVYEGPKKAMPGTGGHQLFRFQAAGADGTDATLNLEYKRPFEKDQPPARTFTLTVHISK